MRLNQSLSTSTCFHPSHVDTRIHHSLIEESSGQSDHASVTILPTRLTDADHLIQCRDRDVAGDERTGHNCRVVRVVGHVNPMETYGVLSTRPHAVMDA